MLNGIHMKAKTKKSHFSVLIELKSAVQSRNRIIALKNINFTQISDQLNQTISLPDMH